MAKIEVTRKVESNADVSDFYTQNEHIGISPLMFCGLQKRTGRFEVTNLFVSDSSLDAFRDSLTAKGLIQMKKLVLFFITIMTISGCVTTSAHNLRKISLHMTKGEVVNKLGEPTVVRGSITNKFNQVIEVWEYRLSQSQAGQFWGGLGISIVTFGIWAPVAYEDSQNDIRNCWLYFYDGKLVQWGQAGDWGKEADRIYGINFAILI